MFKEMRKIDRIIDKDEMKIILKSGEYGILSTINKNGFPYGVPVNYVYNNENIYISTTLGNKIENIEENNKVSFCIINVAQELSDDYSTYYESVIVYGFANIIKGVERDRAISLISSKYSNFRLDRDNDDLIIIKIKIEQETGKLRKQY